MGPLYGLPRGTQPGGVGDFLDRIVHPEDREADAPARSRRRSSTARRTSSTCASCSPTAASAGCTPARARSRHRRPHRAHHRPAQRRHRAPPPRGGARVPRRRQPGAGRVDGPGARRSRRSRSSPSRGSPTGARSSSPTPSAQVAVAHVDPEKVRWARELQERYPPDPDAPTGAPAVIRTGRSELYPVIDRALLEAAALDEEQIAARARAADELGDGRPAHRPRPHARRDDVRVGGVRAASTRRASSSWPRSSAAAPGSRSTTRGCSRASTRTAETLQRALLPGRRCRSCPATSSSCATCRATRATTPAATGTTRSGCRTGASGS